MFLTLLVGVGLLVLAVSLGNTDTDTQTIEVTGNPAIDALIPSPGSEVLRQNRIGIDVAPGFSAELALVRPDGNIAIPTDELLESTDDLFLFQPGEGKVIERLDAEENCIQATYYLLAEPSARRQITWCFTAA